MLKENIVLDTNCLVMSLSAHNPYNAIFIVTEDKHFKELENIPFPKVEVIGIDDFLKYLKK